MSTQKVGLSPGSLVHVGDQSQTKCKVSTLTYNQTLYDLQHDVEVSTIDLSDKTKQHWIHVDGVHDAALMQQLGAKFGLHQLVLEDVMNTEHRPKAEDNDASLFFTFKIFSFQLSEAYHHSDQMSLILGDNWVLSFVEEKVDLFKYIINNLEQGKGQVKTKPIDYLFYRLIDTVVDHYFSFKEKFSETIDELEEEVIEHPKRSSMEKNRQLKKDVMNFRKSVNASREAVNNLMLFNSELLSKDTHRYLRDVKDHLIFISESVEGYRETLGNITELYHSSLGHRTNEVMKVLTIISTIFIPLTFIAGIYGMNFKHMPELEWGHGYYATLLVMVVITLSMLFYFKRKKWL